MNAPPDNPEIEWFAAGIIKRRKLDGFLLSPTHEDGKHKLRLWRIVFGIAEGDAALLDRLIRDQLGQAKPVKKSEKVDRDDPSRVYRRWELVIPRFEGPNGNVGPVLTAWALVPGADRPHLTTAYPDVG